MTRGVPKRFHRLPIRVAASATAVVAVLYLVVAGVVFAIVRQNLIGALDGRLTTAVATVQAHGLGPDGLGDGRPTDPDADHDARFSAPILEWIVASDGTVVSSDPSAVLPASDRHLSTPVDGVVSGANVRLAGGPIATGWLIVGQSTAEISRALQTVIVAESISAPILLLAVFIGAWWVGQRVASPIERARRRQLDFIADASHELRTPLTVIDAETSLALGSVRQAETDQQVLEHIRAESQHMSRLVRDLLWLAGFDAAPAAPDAAPVDVGALATTTADRFRAVCDQRGIRLETHVTGNSGPVITAPAEWLARLVAVLVDNAVKYSPTDGRIRIEVAADVGRVRLIVQDNGPGIPVAQRDRVLDRFHRATDQPGGAGLGLAIADAIVRATGARWDIGDAPGGGARMAVSWPRTPGGTYAGRSLEQSVGLGDSDAIV